MNFYDKVIKTIEREHMLNHGDTVVVGVSGGADSMCLLNTLLWIGYKYDLKLKVCHVNHKIRKGTAERDANFVKAFCEKHNVPFFLKEVDIPKMAKEMKVSEEEAGRIARYNFFESVAGKDGKIATAHNKNDNVETVLMRMMRGTGLCGLAGIPYVRGNIIRPLLDISRDEIEQYMSEMRLNYITDETNLETDYTRNKIRLELIPYLQRTFNPSVIDTIGDNIRSYANDAKYIDENTETDDMEIPLDVETLRTLSKAISTRKIIHFLKNNAGYKSVSTKLVDDVFSMVERDNKNMMSLRDNKALEIRDGKLCVVKASCENMEIHVEPVEQEIYIPCLNSIVKVSIEENREPVTNSPTTVYIPFDNAKNLVLRNRLDGDRFLTCNENGFHKKVSRLSNFDDVVLTMEEDVIWILNKQAWNLTIESRIGKFLKLEIV